MNRALRKEEGFTLVEIIVVIVIMAILAAIAVPSVLGYINDANDAKYLAEARAVYLAIQVEEAKFNASAGNTDPSEAAYVFAAEGGETTIVNAVKLRFPSSATEDIAGEVTGISYNSDKKVYTINFQSSDNKAVVAEVLANDEITIK